VRERGDQSRNGETTLREGIPPLLGMPYILLKVN